MAVTFFPFNSILVGGVPDRPANAENLAAYLASFFSNGVLMHADTALQVKASSGMNVQISAGVGNINGKTIHNDDAKIMTLASANATLSRIDRVVFRLDETNRLMEFAVLTGTPASSPVAPALTQTAGIYELCLAEITVSAGVSVITENNITDTRANSELCGISSIPGHMQDVAHGGTGANTAAAARQNINFIGYVPFSGVEKDTAENWAALGTGIVMVNVSDSSFGWHCSDGGSFPKQGMILNCVSGTQVYQILLDHYRILTREMGTDSSVDYVWTSFVPHDEIPQDIDQWDYATRSTNVNSDAEVVYKVVGNEVRVRVTNCTTKLEMTASNFNNKKLIGQGLPAPRVRQIGNGLVGNSIAHFFVEPSDDTNPGYLRFCGVSGEIATGTKIEAAFSYIMD